MWASMYEEKQAGWMLDAHSHRSHPGMLENISTAVLFRLTNGIGGEASRNELSTFHKKRYKNSGQGLLIMAFG